MKVKNKQGFTLAELLIVMAIIVVLAAVAIPTFGRQLETSRETGDMENIRNAYTDALSLAILDFSDGKLDGKKSDGSTAITGVTSSSAGAATIAITIDPIKSTGDWQYVNNIIAGSAVGTPTKDHNTVTFSFTVTDGVLGLAASSPITLSKVTP